MFSFFANILWLLCSLNNVSFAINLNGIQHQHKQPPPGSPPPAPLVAFLTNVQPSFPQQPVQPTPCGYYYFLLPIDCRALQQQSAQPIVLPPAQLAQQPLKLQSMQTQNPISFVNTHPFQCVF